MTENGALELHEKWRGKIEIGVRAPMSTMHDLSMAYTPGVAEPCRSIAQDAAQSYLYTRRWNTVAVVTDGSAVLGLGDIGPEAALPVMEGKCALFKRFADIDAWPICIKSKDPDEITRTAELISAGFGGINLEDISAPRCFEIEKRLKAACDIPVFHDDQHGTAVVATAALRNACRLRGSDLFELVVTVSGAGAAGMAVTRLLLESGVRDVIVCDVDGVVEKSWEGLDPERYEIIKKTNRSGVRGSLADAVRGADVFFGLSAPGVLTKEMVRSMALRPIIFAMANPTPEIMPDEAKEAGAFIVGTGRSDFANQINNALAFPGIFRGALDVRSSDINTEMKLAASAAIASLVKEEDLSVENIIPGILDSRLAASVAEAVADAARTSGVARI